MCWPIGLAAAIVFASSRSVPKPLDPVMTHFDKLVHFGVYGLIATLIVRLRPLQRNHARAALIAIAIVSLFGVSDEWHQAFTAGRSSDFADWVADTLGAAVAVFLYLRWTGYRRFLELRIFRARAEKPRVEMIRLAVPNPGE